MMGIFRSFCWLPIIVPSLLVVTVLVCYFLSTLEKKEPFFLPTISETGDYPPMSCIFTWGLSTTAFLMFGVFYLKYKYTIQLIFLAEEYFSSLRKWKKYNQVSLGFGFISMFTLNIVASFQSNAVPIVHYLAATTFFLTGIIHVVIQAIVDLQIHKFYRKHSRELSHLQHLPESLWILRFRIVLVISILITWICGTILAFLWWFHANSEPWWNWIAFTEFCISFWFLLYILSYSSSLRRIHNAEISITHAPASKDFDRISSIDEPLLAHIQ